MFIRAALLCLGLVPAFVLAEASTCAAEQQTGAECVPVDQFNLAFAFGAGFRSNPLFSSKNIPLWIMPDLSYYTESWFFDNGTLGYSLALGQQGQLSLVSRFNEEKGYFYRRSVANIFPQHFIADAGLAGPTEKTQQAPELLWAELDKRPLALDAGLQFDWLFEHLQLRANWWHDVSQQYKGQHFRFAASTGWHNSSGQWQISAAMAYKDANLINTYYGLNANEGQGVEFQAEASWQPELALHWQYPLTSQWALLSHFRYRWLHIQGKYQDNELTERSPLLKESTSHSWFVGVSYRFY